MPDFDFYNILRHANTHRPEDLDEATQEENCAALIWASAYLESGQSIADWDQLPDHLVEVLLDLYYLPPSRASSPTRTVWDRLAISLRLFSPYECKPAPIFVSPSPPPGHFTPPALSGAMINTVRGSNPPMARPIPGPAITATSVLQPPSVASAPGPPTNFWAFLSAEPAALPAPNDTLPPVLRNVMDPNPDMDPTRKRKLIESYGKPGCTNNQTRPAACYLASFILGNGQPLDAILRGIAIGLGCRSALVDDRGNAVPLESDPNWHSYESLMGKFATSFLAIDWTSGALSHITTNDLKKAVVFCYTRALAHSSSYRNPDVEHHVQRMCKEIPNFLEGVIDVITQACKAEPEHLRWWVFNKTIYTLYYPCIAEHILGRSGINEELLKAEVARVFAVPPMGNAHTRWPTSQPLPTYASLPPPPPYTPPVTQPQPPSAAVATPWGPPAAQKFLPAVPPFTASAAVAQLYPGRGRRQPHSRPTSTSTPRVASPRSFTGRPCSPAIVGDDIGIKLQLLGTCCWCAISSVTSPHRTWECPFNYFTKFQSCPGFLPSGAKDPSAWHPSSNILLPATRALWKTYIASHSLQKANDATGDVAF